ncbi:gastrula zinc finger protein XlCGF26.1-like [Phlebotomus papatasi]|uniref:Uncharacterized protein n=1 Tax=Phlebotomus papatasi TaxID=29031 RepID=A0A1B0D874_PHLPP|nr:gastrula zinc finger protein XlCGF26.1-like [Phlebotomus papatasi]
MSSQEIEGNTICRFCLRKVKIFCQIFKKSQEEVQDAVSNLNSILNLNIQEDDNWPKQICLPCKKQSGNCVRFYRKIKVSEKKLLEIYGQSSQRIPEVPFEEVSVGVESCREEVLDENDFRRTSDESREEELVSKSQECVEPVGKPKRSTRKLKEDTEKQKVLRIGDELVKKYLGFRCDLCPEDCRNYYRLKFHYRTVHKVTGYVICCGKKFTTLGVLTTHLQLHANPEAFKCSMCAKTFLSERTMRFHVESCLKPIEKCSFVCDQCPKVFPSAKRLYFHRRYHASEDEKRFKCQDCPRSYLTPSELRRHRMKFHEKIIDTFVCSSCGKTYRTKCELKKHTEQHHSERPRKRVECGRCGGFYATKISLEIHLKRCKADPAKCEECGKILSNKLELRKHIRYNHSGLEKKFQCKICPKAFKAKKHLEEHAGQHTKVPIHRCSFCPREFCTQSAKYSHQRKHHPEENEAAKNKKKLPDNYSQ